MKDSLMDVRVVVENLKIGYFSFVIFLFLFFFFAEWSSEMY